MAEENKPEISKDATSNPLADHLSITVSIPDTIQIKMVDASALEDYEIWFFLASLAFGAVIGFGVPFIQSCKSTSGADVLLGSVTGFIIVLFVVFFIMALKKRHVLKNKSKNIAFKAIKY